jgi:hypothetical protein
MNLILYTQTKVYLIYLIYFLFSIKNKNFFKFIIDKKKYQNLKFFRIYLLIFFLIAKKKGFLLKLAEETA